MTDDPGAISHILLIRLRANLVGTFAGQLADLLAPLDADCPAILDFAVVTSIDGYGINVIAEALARGVNLQLVAVRSRVRRMFRQARAISEEQFAEDITAALAAIDRAAGDGQDAPEADRRRSQRVRSHIPVEVLLTVGGQQIATDGIIRDISEGGVYIELAQRLSDILGCDIASETGFDLQFALPEVTYPVLAQANTVHAESRAATLYCGVRFGDLTYLDEDAIRIFLYRHDPDRRAGSA